MVHHIPAVSISRCSNECNIFCQIFHNLSASCFVWLDFFIHRIFGRNTPVDVLHRCRFERNENTNLQGQTWKLYLQAVLGAGDVDPWKPLRVDGWNFCRSWVFDLFFGWGNDMKFMKSNRNCKTLTRSRYNTGHIQTWVWSEIPMLFQYYPRYASSEKDPLHYEVFRAISFGRGYIF